MMSGAGELSLAGVLLLSEVDVLQLAGGDSAACGALCRGECERWDWRPASQSCVLDHRQDLRGVREEEESSELILDTTEVVPRLGRGCSKTLIDLGTPDGGFPD